MGVPPAATENLGRSRQHLGFGYMTVNAGLADLAGQELLGRGPTHCLPAFAPLSGAFAEPSDVRRVWHDYRNTRHFNKRI